MGGGTTAQQQERREKARVLYGYGKMEESERLEPKGESKTETRPTSRSHACSYFFLEAFSAALVTMVEGSVSMSQGCPMQVTVHTLATGLVGLLHRFDNTDSNRLSHVTDGEATKWRVLSERLNTHGLRGDELDDGGITGLDELGRCLDRFTRSTINFLQELRELARNMCGVAIEYRGVAGADLTRVIENNDLGIERGSLFRGVVLRIGGDITTANFFDRDVPATWSAMIKD